MAEEPALYAKQKGSRFYILSLQRMGAKQRYVKDAATKKWYLSILYNALTPKCQTQTK
ncbi:hypothetical protein HNQ56_004291 [Anaerotaenia torta]|uniref:hypothetical protein n=1 Tax=Anaerotaenia torta TaxID=433293 RepID=UPI003D1C6D48